MDGIRWVQISVKVFCSQISAQTCPGQGENPEMEVVGYMIDHFLQFHTVSI